MSLLSTAREVEDGIRDAQALIHEVEMEMRRLFQDPFSAYQRVMFRRAHPNEAAGKEASSSRGDRRNWTNGKRLRKRSALPGMGEERARDKPGQDGR